MRKKWCIPTVGADFVWRMEDVLDVYTTPYNPRRPQVCLDELTLRLTRPSSGFLDRLEGRLRLREGLQIFRLERVDPAMRRVVGGRATERWAASTSQMPGQQEGSAFNGYFSCRWYHRRVASQRLHEERETFFKAA